ncbi:TPA: hypothetical protein RMT63_004764 [Escherichia coli]|nr:hypothetical protein [Escherichia coli]
MLPSETMIWQPEFTDKTLSRKPGAVHPALADKTCTELFHLVDMAVMDGDEIMQYRKQSFSPLCNSLW